MDGALGPGRMWTHNSLRDAQEIFPSHADEFPKNIKNEHILPNMGSFWIEY